jgi:hypothetical protein
MAKRPIYMAYLYGKRGLLTACPCCSSSPLDMSQKTQQDAGDIMAQLRAMNQGDLSSLLGGGGLSGLYGPHKCPPALAPVKLHPCLA